jgi:glycosyltransferase involved in cell wall biosynthesis
MDIKKRFVSKIRRCISPNYRLLLSLEIFDVSYYLDLASKDEVDEIDPLWGYIRMTGNDYLKTGILSQGWRQFADPHLFFDTAYYLLRYFPEGLSENPFAHYLKKGWQEGLQPGPYFDPEVYRTRSNWQSGDPLSHYTRVSAELAISPARSFDIDYYLDRNPVFIPAREGIIKHYKFYGARIGKSPLPVFDPAYYLDQLTCSGANRYFAEKDPLAHYLCGTAVIRSCRPAPWFDSEYYAEQIGNVPKNSRLLEHYIEFGVHSACYTDSRVAELPQKPMISVLVPVYNPDHGFLQNCIRSVLYQAYPHWQLCLADDCSTDPAVRDLLLSWAEKDSRIKVTFLPENSGIATATNQAALLATGEYLGFLDNDDELRVDCLYHVAKSICDTAAELIYTDEDLIGDDGSQLSIFRKPDFNSELLLSHNYITHFVVTLRRLFEQIGGLDSGADGAQDYDLMLKLTEQTARVSHIPQVLYHWRASETSTSINHQQKNYAHQAGRNALDRALKRRKIRGKSIDSDLNFFYRLEAAVATEKKIAVFLCVDHYGPKERHSLQQLIGSTTYENVRFIIIAAEQTGKDGEVESAILGDFRSVTEKLTVFALTELESKSAAVDRAIRATNCHYLAFLDLQFIEIQADWLEQLAATFRQQSTGLVCGRVSYGGSDGPSLTLPDLENHCANYYSNFLQWSSRHANGLHCPQELFCCGWQITLVKRDLYLQMGGFSLEYSSTDFAMMDLAIRARNKGLSVLYTPWAKINLPEERLSESAEDNQKIIFQRRWNFQLAEFSRYYNLGLLDDAGIDRDTFQQWLRGTA